MALITVRSLAARWSVPVRNPKYMVTPISARPATSKPVMAPARNASSRPPASDPIAAWAVRTFARTETFMPMKPVRPDRIAPMAKPTPTSQPRK